MNLITEQFPDPVEICHIDVYIPLGKDIAISKIWFYKTGTYCSSVMRAVLSYDHQLVMQFDISKMKTTSAVLYSTLPQECIPDHKTVEFLITQAIRDSHWTTNEEGDKYCLECFKGTVDCQCV